MTARGAAWQNGYAERLMRTIKEEEVYLSEYRDYADAHRQIGRFLDDVYMHKRIHSALGYLTPVEFALQWEETDDGRRGHPLKIGHFVSNFWGSLQTTVAIQSSYHAWQKATPKRMIALSKISMQKPIICSNRIDTSAILRNKKR